MTSEKLHLLKEILAREKKLAVAFSGGIDSTFLLSVAVEVLGTAKVWAFHLSSVLQGTDSTRQTLSVVNTDFPADLQFERVEIHPLGWPEFVNNSDSRCYHCKKRMYSVLLSRAVSLDIKRLADGTNADDLQEHRPGIKALREMGIMTPLEMAGLRKAEIRLLARKRCLSNYNLASNSCLATRVQTFKKITEKELQLIDRAETCLVELGFHGSRVRVGGRYGIIEIAENDFHLLTPSSMRRQIEEKFAELGIPNPAFRLKGR